jgi:hypothetical protein
MIGYKNLENPNTFICSKNILKKVIIVPSFENGAFKFEFDGKFFEFDGNQGLKLKAVAFCLRR